MQVGPKTIPREGGKEILQAVPVNISHRGAKSARHLDGGYGAGIQHGKI